MTAEKRTQAESFSPIKINQTEIRNRIAMAPMGIGGLVTEDGCFTKRARDYYVERAKGGTGLIITSVTKVENEIEEFEPGVFPNVSINPVHFVETASEMTERIHAHDSKVFLQLAVGFGRVASPAMLKKKPVAPSAIPNYWDPSVTCRELSTEEVETLISKTVAAAEIAREAGFDGVEIHAVHEGYLLDQFAIDLFNNRTDKYGGNLKERLNFPNEIVRGIKNELGEDFPVTLRYSIKNYIKDWGKGGLSEEDFEEKGRDLEEGLKAAQILEKSGYDGLTADGGSYDAWYWAHPPIYQEHGCYLPLTKKLKEVVDIPLIIAGRMGLPDLALETIDKGEAADMVCLGRPLLSDPHWPKKVKENNDQNIRPCIGCHDGCLGRIFEGKPLSCAVNPACGREENYAIPKAREKKNIMVIGGGVAGMEAARTAALKGHDVELFEKRSKLGGHVIDTAEMEFKKDEERLINWYQNALENNGVEVNLNQEIKTENIDDKYDEIVVATGSSCFQPEINGIDSCENTTTATNLLLGEEKAEDKTIIIGGGLVGCETAYWLAKDGKEVTIIEQLDELMKSGISVPHANEKMLKDLMNYENVKTITGKTVVEVNENTVTLIDDNAVKEELNADTIVTATGLKPDKSLYNELEKEYANLHLIGDAREAQNIMHAIWEGYEVGRSI